MEEQRDNIIKDISVAQGHAKNALETMDKSLIQSAKRAANIVSALYIVSNVLPVDEPLQKEIRKAGLTLLSLSNDMAGVKGESYDRLTNEINITIRKITSFLEVGVTMYLISEMNFRILRLELMALGGSYESRRGGLIDIEGILKETSIEKVSRTVKPTSIKDIKKDIEEPLIINVLNKPLTPTFGFKSFIKDKSTTSNNGNSDRKSSIIDSIQYKESSTIADIKTGFPDVSFKTIQRDLQSLIDEGKIERIGERRWSTYRIKDN